MQKSCVWDLFLLQFLCLFCPSLGQLVVFCSKWHLPASQLLLWTNAWDRYYFFLGKTCFSQCGLEIVTPTLQLIWNWHFLCMYCTMGCKGSKRSFFLSISVSFSNWLKHIFFKFLDIIDYRWSTNITLKLFSYSSLCVFVL